MAEVSTKLVCNNVWKLFGPNASSFLQEQETMPELEELLSAGLIGAVRNVSLTVKEGEIFVIMGLSGSGKSTLIRLLSRLIEPTAGEINFNGLNLLSATKKELIQIRRHHIGMVF
ncbi:MAG: ATP-binding cassette domain-containing protein, partial [Kiloniellales bacterium]|nr:ATP-binding cassette domain-containing protein [Kiloniellales bacterium]